MALKKLTLYRRKTFRSLKTQLYHMIHRREACRFKKNEGLSSWYFSPSKSERAFRGVLTIHTHKYNHLERY